MAKFNVVVSYEEIFVMEVVADNRTEAELIAKERVGWDSNDIENAEVKSREWFIVESVQKD